MRGMKRLAWLAAAIVLAPALVRADAPQGRTEISILVGVSVLDLEEETSGFSILDGIEPPPPLPPEPFPLPFELGQRRTLGGSFLQGFKVGRYVSDRGEAELFFSVAPSHHLRSESFIGCTRGRPCPFAAQEGSRPAPVFSGQEKVAAYHYGLDFTYDLARGDVRPFLSFGAGAVSYDVGEEVKTNFAFGFGAGAKMYLGKVGARLEVGDRVVTNHFLTRRTEHDLQVRAGFVFRLP